MIKYLNETNLSKKLKQYKISELRSLCEELRLKIIDSVIECGGHLSSSLGAVDIIVALHFVFDFPKDKLIFDVGHQAYAHKLLTGRADNFEHLLRKFKGIGAFPKKEESIYDTFTTGHAGNSLSLGVGLARARDISGEDYNVVSLVGDSSLTSGMNFEAMNDCGSKPTKHIVVLNDNDMSISKAVGAVSSKLTLLREKTFYKNAKNRLSKVIGVKQGSNSHIFLKKIKKSLKYMVTTGVLFEEFGYKYIGPIDGHDLGELINALEVAKKEDAPVILHVVTKKGKGCKEAEEQPDVFHGLKSRDTRGSKKTSYSQVFGERIVEIATNNEKIVTVCAGMRDGVGLKEFSQKFPNRFFDVGIAEEHATSMSAGLAEGGMKAYLSIYSTFLQRSFDQVLHDIALQKLPVKIFVDRAGITGEDGETHQGIFDSSFLSIIPNVQIWSPASLKEFSQMIDMSVDFDKPLIVRYPKGNVDNVEFSNFSQGKWSYVGNLNGCVAIIGTGATVIKQCIMASKLLKENGIDACVVNASTVKPIDYELINKFRNKKIVVVEDNVERGGLAENIAFYSNSQKINIQLLAINVGDNFVPQGEVSILQEEFGLSGQKITKKTIEFLKNS